MSFNKICYKNNCYWKLKIKNIAFIVNCFCFRTCIEKLRNCFFFTGLLMVVDIFIVFLWVVKHGESHNVANEKIKIKSLTKVNQVNHLYLRDIFLCRIASSWTWSVTISVYQLSVHLVMLVCFPAGDQFNDLRNDFSGAQPDDFSTFTDLNSDLETLFFFPSNEFFQKHKHCENLSTFYNPYINQILFIFFSNIPSFRRKQQQFSKWFKILFTICAVKLFVTLKKFHNFGILNKPVKKKFFCLKNHHKFVGTSFHWGWKKNPLVARVRDCGGHMATRVKKKSKIFGAHTWVGSAGERDWRAIRVSS